MLRQYFNGKAGTWDENVTEKDTGKLACMADRLNLKPGYAVLDVGTGTGVFLPYLLDKVGQEGKVVALDIAEEMLAVSRKKNTNQNVRYMQADICSIPMNGGVFDTIVCYSSFPHFRDKPKSLAEMKRVLKKGGSLVICHTSSRAHINEIHSQIPIVKEDILPDVDEMRKLMSSAGLDVLVAEEDSDSYFVSAENPA